MSADDSTDARKKPVDYYTAAKVSERGALAVQILANPSIDDATARAVALALLREDFR